MQAGTSCATVISATKHEASSHTLRITTNRDSATATLKFEGRVAGAWISECFRAWQSLIPDLGTRKLCIDLRGVTFVDDDGARFLAEIYREHRAQFLTNSPLTRYFAESAIDHSTGAIGTSAKRDGE